MLWGVLQIEAEIDAPFLDGIRGELLLKLLVGDGLGQCLELLGSADEGFTVVAPDSCGLATSGNESVQGVQVTRDVEGESGCGRPLRSDRLVATPIPSSCAAPGKAQSDPSQCRGRRFG